MSWLGTFLLRIRRWPAFRSSEINPMAKHYSYRVDHDTGFAPHVEGGLCMLCGCKKRTVERWAKAGSWVVGIGGNNTGKPDSLIYAMKVDEILTCSEFKKTRP